MKLLFNKCEKVAKYLTESVYMYLVLKMKKKTLTSFLV